MDENLIGIQQEFSIGDVKISPKRNLLIVEKVELSLEPRVMDVLCYLSRHAPDVVSRDGLIEHIWEVEYGGDESLTRAISILRKTFRSIGIDETIIETIPKRGYRLTKLPHELSAKGETVSFPVKAGQNRPEKTRSGISLGKIATAAAIILAAIVAIANIPTSSSPQKLLQQMVEEGTISAEDANSLQKAIADKSGSQTDDAIELALEQKDKDRIIALAQMQDPSSFMKGLDQLETLAKSYDDWRLIAEIAYGLDPNRAIKAADRGLAIIPDDFFLQNFKAQTLAKTGRLIEARKSIEALITIAKSDNEQFLAEFTYLNTLVLIDDAVLVEKAQSSFEVLLKNLEDSLPDNLEVKKKVSEPDADYHPYWSLGSGYLALASSNIYLDKPEKALQYLDQSDSFFRAFIPVADSTIAFAPLRRLFGNNKLRTELLKNDNRYEDALKAQQENLQLCTDLENIGFESIGLFLPNTWREMSELYLLIDEPENAIDALENSERAYQALLNDNPNNTKAYKGLTQSQEKLAALKNGEDQP